MYNTSYFLNESEKWKELTFIITLLSICNRLWCKILELRIIQYENILITYWQTVVPFYKRSLILPGISN